MVQQSVPADSVSALRESALAAAGVRGIFTNLIDGESVGARNTLDVLDPATLLPAGKTTHPAVGRAPLPFAPLGVVPAISPGNLPLFLSSDRVVPALIAGNTVVLKPSFYTPLPVLRVAELVRDILPAGIL